MKRRDKKQKEKKIPHTQHMTKKKEKKNEEKPERKSERTGEMKIGTKCILLYAKGEKFLGRERRKKCQIDKNCGFLCGKQDNNA